MVFLVNCCWRSRSSVDAVDGLSGSDSDGVEVDWVVKDPGSVEVDGKDEGGVTLPILN